MKNGILRALKEIGILLLMLVILAGAAILAFYKQVPYSKEVPTADAYAAVNSSQYSVSSTDRLQSINSVTVTHEANSSQIVQAENDVRIETGRATPFGNIESVTDLPNERVGSSIVIEYVDSNGNVINNSGDELQYPTTPIEDAENIKQDILDSENKTASSALNDRLKTD